MRTRHLDDFALLRYTAGDLDDSERGDVEHHLDECEACLITLAEVRLLDGELRAIGSARAATDADGELAPGDPFRERPQTAPWTSKRVAPDFVELAVEASERGRADVESLLDATGEPGRPADYLRGLSFDDPRVRYLVLYALEEAGSRISIDGPSRASRLAEAVLRWLEEEPAATCRAEEMVGRATIFGQAHVLAGQACNWAGSLEKAGEHFDAAYRTFADSRDLVEIRLALTEFHESQRRAFAGRPREGLLLARRARATFEEFGFDDYVARARMAEGIALSELHRDAEALDCERAALPVFERMGLWTNYVSALNSVGASLARLGRLDEARREYSRALRKLSRDRHASILPFIRHGLGIVLASAGRHREAAGSFLQAARLFESLDLVGDSLTSSLWEIESWARSGDRERALHRLEIFRSSLARPEALAVLDPFLVDQLGDALSGRDGNFERLAALRDEALERIREKLQSRAS